MPTPYGVAGLSCLPHTVWQDCHAYPIQWNRIVMRTPYGVTGLLCLPYTALQDCQAYPIRWNRIVMTTPSSVTGFSLCCRSLFHLLTSVCAIIGGVFTGKSAILNGLCHTCTELSSLGIFWLFRVTNVCY